MLKLIGSAFPQGISDITFAQLEQETMFERGKAAGSPHQGAVALARLELGRMVGGLG